MIVAQVLLALTAFATLALFLWDQWRKATSDSED